MSANAAQRAAAYRLDCISRIWDDIFEKSNAIQERVERQALHMVLSDKLLLSVSGPSCGSAKEASDE